MCRGYTHTFGLIIHTHIHTHTHSHTHSYTHTHSHWRSKDRPVSLDCSHQTSSDLLQIQYNQQKKQLEKRHFTFGFKTASVLNSQRNRIPMIRVCPKSSAVTHTHSSSAGLSSNGSLRLFASLTARHWSNATQHELTRCPETRIHWSGSTELENPGLELRDLDFRCGLIHQSSSYIIPHAGMITVKCVYLFK